jgi:2-succinyl-5-enolpyruvyl-6-hydroxy-3-cyclohexene-1-carboxylate synthase
MDELASCDITSVCISPGSRSTPLTVAAAEHPDIRVYSHLDERSSAFFALGRARRTGDPTPLICTSGTAAANFHPAVIEGNQAGVPMILLTADRPPELTDSGANQTINQERLYGDAVRWYKDMPEPEASARKMRMLRTTICRALTAANGSDPGPVHLNCRFRKPLEPTAVPDTHPDGVPDDWSGGDDLAADGRDGPFVRAESGRSTLPVDAVTRLATAANDASRGLIVAGPSDRGPSAETIETLATATGFPVLADPLSDCRFGDHVDSITVCGGYDGYIRSDPVAEWPDPEVVIRFGASPTAKPLRKYLRDTDCQQFVIDPRGGWPEAEFTATDLYIADPDHTATVVAERVETDCDPAWRDRFERAERIHWETVSDALDGEYWEGGVVADVSTHVPDPTTLFVSNSMPVRDLDRFARPRDAELTVLGNRGASGIDGIISTALGAGSATTDPLVVVTGDLAYYHDMNGLLALDRCDVDATIVLINNDGGGIFHMLPIEDDDTFEPQFKTPHGLDFEPTGDLYDLTFRRVDDRSTLIDSLTTSVGTGGTTVLSVEFDAALSHTRRDRIQTRVTDQLRRS